MNGADLRELIAEADFVLDADQAIEAVDGVFAEQLFPLGDIDEDEAFPEVEHTTQDRPEVLRPTGWPRLPVAAPSGGRRA